MDLSTLSLSELRERARKNGIPVSGTKTDLVERLQKAPEQPTDTPDESPLPDTDPAGSAEDTTPLDVAAGSGGPGADTAVLDPATPH